MLLRDKVMTNKEKHEEGIETCVESSVTFPKDKISSTSVIDEPAYCITDASQSQKKRHSFIYRIISKIWSGIANHKIFKKILTLLFAVCVFSLAYDRSVWYRNELSFIGFMLLMVFVYVEILIIRDHLWVIEGSMRETRRWRDVFFNQTSLRRQRIRKYLVIIFATGVFSFLYYRIVNSDFPRDADLVRFLGTILMATVLYYEILTVRDEVMMISQSIHDFEQNSDNNNGRITESKGIALKKDCDESYKEEETESSVVGQSDKVL